MDGVYTDQRLLRDQDRKLKLKLKQRHTPCLSRSV
jgi:hypothetical protein